VEGLDRELGDTRAEFARFDDGCVTGCQRTRHTAEYRVDRYVPRGDDPDDPERFVRYRRLEVGQRQTGCGCTGFEYALGVVVRPADVCDPRVETHLHIALGTRGFRVSQVVELLAVCSEPAHPSDEGFPSTVETLLGPPLLRTTCLRDPLGNVGSRVDGELPDLFTRGRVANLEHRVAARLDVGRHRGHRGLLPMDWTQNRTCSSSCPRC